MEPAAGDDSLELSGQGGKPQVSEPNKGLAATSRESGVLARDDNWPDILLKPHLQCGSSGRKIGNPPAPSKRQAAETQHHTGSLVTRIAHLILQFSTASKVLTIGARSAAYCACAHVHANTRTASPLQPHPFPASVSSRLVSFIGALLACVSRLFSSLPVAPLSWRALDPIRPQPRRLVWRIDCLRSLRRHHRLCVPPRDAPDPSHERAGPESLRAPLGTVAALTILSQNEPSELSLQQHLELAPDLVAYNNLVAEGEPEHLMMAQPVPHQPTDKKRVKVYELRNNDWFDRGTGFCSATFATIEDGRKDPRVVVESEDQPDRLLLETKIQKEDGFQKQQETLIVWQEPTSGVDMALSFQEPEGCAMIWRFVSSVQQTFHNNLAGADDGLSDDLAIEVPATINLPPAELGNLEAIDMSMRQLSNRPEGRDALTKAIMAEEYILKLIPLVEMAEDLESLQDLHRLCNIMKSIILLNDTSIIEHAVSDECVLGVVGALEYDPDFPSHKANHRHWLDNQGRYKEVVPIQDETTRRKIHQTYRLQYLKDVVLARILDDPTFSVLNSLIFFNQVDIVQHLQSNSAFLNELFGIFNSPVPDPKRKKEAVLFIQQCCAIAKNIQPPARQTLYNNFIAHGLLPVIHFGLRHGDVGVRVGATDILISIIDHDPQMIRQTLYRQMHENQPPLTDSLIELLLVEVDLGVKSQISEALKVLLDPGAPVQGPENFVKANGEFAGRQRPQPTIDPQQDLFLTRFYERSIGRLFKPLLDLERRTDMNFKVQEASMFTYLIEILSYFVRQHNLRSKFFIMSNNVAQCVAQLLKAPEKFLRLVAIRFFRCLIGLQDEFYIKHLTEKQVLGPILEVLIATMPRDNLLSSACLDFFEYIKKENLKDLVKHLVQGYRERLQILDYMPTFRDIVLRYDQTQGYTSNMDYFLEAEDEIGRRPNSNARLMEQITVDQEQEEYWATSDTEDDDEHHGKGGEKLSSTNGTAPSKPLVDYASDEEADENVDPEASQESEADSVADTASSTGDGGFGSVPPPERLSEKRRREEEDDEDELGKLMQNKRRNSSGSLANSAASTGPGVLRRRKSFTAGSGNSNPRKIAISLSATVKTGGGSRSDEDS
ncbi:Fc.00g091280.m01.CDS01 [Cosmosporella sp. VM-42]